MGNIHLATIGAVISSVTVISSEVELVRSHGFFAGYNSVVWFFIVVQAGGGILVAAVIKYTDNIMKGFAAAAGIIATSMLSMLFFNFAPKPFFFLGAVGVIYSILLYGDMLKSFRVFQYCPECLGGPEASFENDGNLEAAQPVDCNRSDISWTENDGSKSCEIVDEERADPEVHPTRIGGAQADDQPI